MNWLVTLQFMCCIETLWTFTANIWLHTFMPKYMIPKDMTVNELLLTNVTCEPSTFIVWLQQMWFQFVSPCKTFWTVSTWERLCTSVTTNMTVQITAHFKQLPTVTTVIRFTVAVYTTFVYLQVAGSSVTFVTQWTLVWFVSRVDCAMSA